MLDNFIISLAFPRTRYAIFPGTGKADESERADVSSKEVLAPSQKILNKIFPTIEVVIQRPLRRRGGGKNRCTRCDEKKIPRWATNDKAHKVGIKN